MTAMFPRRTVLQHGLTALGFGSLAGWFPALAVAASEQPTPPKSVILLWLDGGPATIDLWDLKPGHVNGGPFREIATSAPGLKISEHLPRLAQWGKELAIVRSLTSKEGDHGRATHFVKTGYNPQGAVRFPMLGSLLAQGLPNAKTGIPGFVSIAPGERSADQLGSGFLGPSYDPLLVGRHGAAIADLKVPDLRAESISPARVAARGELLREIEREFALLHPSALVESQHVALDQATRMMSPSVASVFDLDQEPESVRQSYGSTLFGQGCLLARRLVERGVSCVEVTLGGWDTHSNNFELVKDLSTTLDTALSTLLNDLRARQLLASTLVVCLGEFGRTPKINGGAGRDHWPNVWSALLVGGSIRGGQAIGRSSADGTTIELDPVSVPDLIATICTAVGIDPRRQNPSNVGRPIRVADPGAKVIAALL